jgi:hypothetical protein
MAVIGVTKRKSVVQVNGGADRGHKLIYKRKGEHFTNF